MSDSIPTGNDSSARRIETGDLLPLAGIQPFIDRFRNDLGSEGVVSLGRDRTVIRRSADGTRLEGTQGLEATIRDQLAERLSEFAVTAVQAVTALDVRYPGNIRVGRTVLRLTEEATRKTRLSEREDLLHVDSGDPENPQGERVFRVCVNLDADEDRVWAVSESFTQLVDRFSAHQTVPARTRAEWLAPPTTLLRLFSADRPQRSAREIYLSRFNRFLRESDEFQNRATRRIRRFPPGSAWVFAVDGSAFAQLRGRLTLEQTLFVSDGGLSCPESAPTEILCRIGAERSAGVRSTRQAS